MPHDLSGDRQAKCPARHAWGLTRLIDDNGLHVLQTGLLVDGETSQRSIKDAPLAVAALRGQGARRFPLWGRGACWERPSHLFAEFPAVLGTHLRPNPPSPPPPQPPRP